MKANIFFENYLGHFVRIPPPPSPPFKMFLLVWWDYQSPPTQIKLKLTGSWSYISLYTQYIHTHTGRQKNIIENFPRKKIEIIARHFFCVQSLHFLA